MARVLKFGGTSVSTAERIREIAVISKSILAEEDKVIVVVSAMGKDPATQYIGTTDFLINMGNKAVEGDKSFKADLEYLEERHINAAKELLNDENFKEFSVFLEAKIANLGNLLNGIFLLKEMSAKALDCVCSFGELCSSKLVALYFDEKMKPTRFLDARRVLRTNSDFGAAIVDFAITNEQILLQTKKEGMYVMGGFIATNDKEMTTTLGRGGSDYTAAIMAAGIKADRLEIWTDVNGVMTADPRKVKDAFSLTHLTYEEAMEMSHFGAKVLHPPTVQPAFSNDIPIYIKNTFEPDYPGTCISREANDEHLVKGVSSIANVSLLNIQGTGLIGVSGIAARLFNALARAKVNIILITQASSEHSITFAVKPEDAERSEFVINNEFEYEINANQINSLNVQNDLSIVAIIGSRMRKVSGISGRMFKSLGQNGINVYAIAQGSSELNISAVVHKNDTEKALSALHESFFLSDTKTLNLFVLGVGLIGGTLLQQIEKQTEKLLKDKSLRFRIVALGNSRKMLFDANGIEIDSYKTRLDSDGNKADLSGFVKRMLELNLPNSIFVDNTASKAPSEFYEEIIKHSISIVTPNKIANTLSQERYENLRRLSKANNARFRYETNVGAGLPVISTLRDLLNSGDEVHKITAVLSGSLSFIFNSFKIGSSFYDIVKEAKEKGYTEPDPRDDLGLTDVARKALILSREIGRKMELSDIEIEAIMPDSCMEAETVEDFFKELESQNGYFDNLLQSALDKQQVLRVMAEITKDKSSVKLMKVDATNPFYSLSGSENMIAFQTERYFDTPLVVRGPGAGAEVTAAGVFAEIISEADEIDGN